MLIEEKERGFQVAEDVLRRALDYTQSGVSRDLSSIEVARTFAYSRYLLTRAGRVPGNDLKNLVLPGNTVMPTVTYSGEAEKIRYTVPKERPYYYSQLQSGFDREIPKVETKKGLEITRDYLNEKGEPIKSAKLGETIQVRLRIRGTTAHQKVTAHPKVTVTVTAKTARFFNS